MNRLPLHAQDLAQVALFTRLTTRLRNECSLLCVKRRYDSPTLLYRSGAINTKIITVLRGSLEIHGDDRNTDLPVDTIYAGDAWGCGSLFAPSTRYHWSLSTAARPTETIELSIPMIIKSAERRTALYAALVHACGQAMAETIQRQQSTLSLMMIASALLRDDAPRTVVLEQLLSLIRELLHSERALIARFDSTARRVTIETISGYPTSLADTSYAFSNDTILTTVYASKQPLIITKKQFERKHGLVPYSRPTMLVVPLIAHTTVHGAMLITDKKGHADFNSGDLCRISPLASLIAATLHFSHEADMVRYGEQLKRSYVAPYR